MNLVKIVSERTERYWTLVKKANWMDKILVGLSFIGLGLSFYAKSETLALMWLIILLQDLSEMDAKRLVRDRDEALEAQRKLIIRQDELISSLETKILEKDAILYGEKK